MNLNITKMGSPKKLWKLTKKKFTKSSFMSSVDGFSCRIAISLLFFASNS